MINKIHRARIEYKCYQLMQSLRIPEGFALEYTDDPASLKEILRRQHNSRSLTIVSDQAFMFFKYMYCKMKSIQTFEFLEKHRTKMLYHTEMKLKCDEKLVDMWCLLFNKVEDCTCEDDSQFESMLNNETFDEQTIDYELEQCLVLDMLDNVVHYFVSVHLSDILAKCKDIVMHKKKTSSTWHLVWFE